MGLSFCFNHRNRETLHFYGFNQTLEQKIRFIKIVRHPVRHVDLLNKMGYKNVRNKSLKTLLKIQNYHNKRGFLKYSKSWPTNWKMTDNFNISDIIFLNLGRNKVKSSFMLYWTFTSSLLWQLTTIILCTFALVPRTPFWIIPKIQPFLQYQTLKQKSAYQNC